MVQHNRGHDKASGRISGLDTGKEVIERFCARQGASTVV